MLWHSIRTLLSKTLKPKAKLKSKSKSKSKPKSNPKLKSKTTPKNSKPTPTPKTKSGKATRTSSVKASKTSSTSKPSSTKTCKQIYALLAKDLKAESLVLEKEEALARRGRYAGGMSNIEKRTKKLGGGCKITLNALDYPNTKQMPEAAKFYGFQNPETCETLVFPAGMSKPATKLTQKDYQIEHS